MAVWDRAAPARALLPSRERRAPRDEEAGDRAPCDRSRHRSEIVLCLGVQYAAESSHSARDALAGLSNGPLGTDPVAGIRSMLAAGQLHDAGSGTVDGRAIRRLVGEELSRPQGFAHSPWPVEYDVDPTTYAPPASRWKRSG